VIRRLFIIAAAIAASSSTYAAIFELPPEGQDVVGAISTVVATYDDTLVDIARRHGLGYQDIVRANPGVGHGSCTAQSIRIATRTADWPRPESR